MAGRLKPCSAGSPSFSAVLSLCSFFILACLSTTGLKPAGFRLNNFFLRAWTRNSRYRGLTLSHPQRNSHPPIVWSRFVKMCESSPKLIHCIIYNQQSPPQSTYVRNYRVLVHYIANVSP